MMINYKIYYIGRPPHNEQWVFGLVDTSLTPALGYMEIVQNRQATTLLPIIQNHVAPGTESLPCYSSFAKCSKSRNSQSLHHIFRSYYRSAYTTHRIILESCKNKAQRVSQPPDTFVLG